MKIAVALSLIFILLGFPIFIYWEQVRPMTTSYQPRVKDHEELLLRLAELHAANQVDAGADDSVDHSEDQAGSEIDGRGVSGQSATTVVSSTPQDAVADDVTLDSLLKASGEITEKLVHLVNNSRDRRYNKTEILSYFQPGELPLLLAALLQDSFHTTWTTLAWVVGEFDEPEITVPVLINYIRRSDRFERLDSSDLFQKARSLTRIGILGGDEAEVLLRECITYGGAKKVGRRFLNRYWSVTGVTARDFPYVMQYHAALGLVYTRVPENVRVVEQLNADLLMEIEDIYENLGTSRSLNSKERSTIFLQNKIEHVLATRDLIEKIGFEEFRPLAMDYEMRSQRLVVEGIDVDRERALPGTGWLSEMEFFSGV